MTRAITQNAQRLVVKIGSALLTNNGAGLDRDAIDGWVEQIAQLLAQGKEIVLVSSGSIAEGIVRLGWKTRPESIHELQAAAAVGQMGLIQTYESSFQRFDRLTAQILLDHDDLANRQRYLNARSALQTDVVEAVTETEADADLLVILTDKDGLYSANPDLDSSAELISEAMADDSSLDALAGGSNSSLGRGGMVTKLQAARLAARSGCNTVIVGGRNSGILTAVTQGQQVGTLLTASQQPLAARKQWLAGQLQVKGQLVLDAGAVKVLQQQGRSLLAVGVTQVKGQFTRGELVSCIDADGREIARGLVNYHSGEAERIKGQGTEHIAEILGYREDDELIHRDNMVVS